MSQPFITLSSGFKMPQVGLGTARSAKGEVEFAVREALKAGYKHLDCAPIYRNEAEIGNVLSEVFSQGKIKRTDVFITSKLWNTCHEPKYVRAECEKTLKDLQLSYLDLYLVHWPYALEFTGLDLSEPFPKDEKGQVKFARVTISETWKAMEKLVDDGLVKSIGLSNCSVATVADVIRGARIPPAVNQIEVNPLLARDPLISFCQSRGVAITAYSTFGGHGSSYLKLPEVEDIGKNHNKLSSQVLVRWAMQRNMVVIPKSVNPDRIKQNIDVFGFQLSDKEMERIKALDRNTSCLMPEKAFGFYPFA